MKTLVTYPHGLGDILMLTPVLRQCPGEFALAILERFRGCGIEEMLAPWVPEFRYVKDPWNDFPHKPAWDPVFKQGEKLARDMGVTHVAVRHDHRENKYVQNFFQLGKEYPRGAGAWRPSYATMVEDLEAAELFVAGREFGFVQTHTGVKGLTDATAKDLPVGWGAEWVRKRGLEVVEVGVSFRHDELPLAVQCEIMRLAQVVVVPDSFFFHAAMAQGREVDVAYFQKGWQGWQRVRPICPSRVRNLCFQLPA